MELNCANKIKNLLFLLGILVLTFAPVHVWAGDNLEGGTYYPALFRHQLKILALTVT